MIDTLLGIGSALAVLLQATLLARIVARAFDGASLPPLRLELELLLLAFALRGALAWGMEMVGRRAAWSVLSELRLALVEYRDADPAYGFRARIVTPFTDAARFREAIQRVRVSKHADGSVDEAVIDGLAKALPAQEATRWLNGRFPVAPGAAYEIERGGGGGADDGCCSDGDGCLGSVTGSMVAFIARTLGWLIFPDQETDGNDPTRSGCLKQYTTSAGTGGKRT